MNHLACQNCQERVNTLFNGLCLSCTKSDWKFADPLPLPPPVSPVKGAS
jgi:hypothetical protein